MAGPQAGGASRHDPAALSRTADQRSVRSLSVMDGPIPRRSRGCLLWHRFATAAPRPRLASGHKSNPRKNRPPRATARYRPEDGEKVAPRSSACDLPMGPTQRKSAVLSELEEAAAVAVRVPTRPPSGDLCSALSALLTSLRGIGLQPDVVSRLPHRPPDKVKRSKACEVGCSHLGIGDALHRLRALPISSWPNLQARLRRLLPQSRQAGCASLPQGPDPDRAVQDPHHRVAFHRRHAQQTRVGLTDNGGSAAPTWPAPWWPPRHRRPR